MAVDLTPVQRAAVETAVARTRNLYSTSREDRFQDAAERVLTASIDPQRSEQETAAYLCARALSGIRDAVRRELRGNMTEARKTGGRSERRGLTRVWDEDDTSVDRLQSPANPEFSLAAKQAFEAVAALGPRHALIAQRLAEGFSVVEIAKECAVTESRISQVRTTICSLIESYL